MILTAILAATAMWTPPANVVSFNIFTKSGTKLHKVYDPSPDSACKKQWTYFDPTTPKVTLTYADGSRHLVRRNLAGYDGCTYGSYGTTSVFSWTQRQLVIRYKVAGEQEDAR